VKDLYGLFKYEYEDYEFEKFICCSEVLAQLFVRVLDTDAKLELTYSISEHVFYGDREQPHYYVKKLEVI